MDEEPEVVEKVKAKKSPAAQLAKKIKDSIKLPERVGQKLGRLLYKVWSNMWEMMVEYRGYTYQEYDKDGYYEYDVSKISMNRFLTDMTKKRLAAEDQVETHLSYPNYRFIKGVDRKSVVAVYCITDPRMMAAGQKTITPKTVTDIVRGAYIDDGIKHLIILTEIPVRTTDIDQLRLSMPSITVEINTYNQRCYNPMINFLVPKMRILDRDERRRVLDEVEIENHSGISDITSQFLGCVRGDLIEVISENNVVKSSISKTMSYRVVTKTH